MAKIGMTGLCLVGMFALNPCALLHAQGVANTTVTVDSMNLPGADAAALAARAGWWDVSETVWARPGAEPAVIHGQVAHRQMVGLYLQEMLYASAQRSDAALHRMDYLGYNRVTGR